MYWACIITKSHNAPFLTHKSSPVLNVVACKKLSQNITNNVDNGDRGIGFKTLLFLANKYTCVFITHF